MSPTIKLADYLFTRLKQLGIESVHGVPGDYNLTLLDFVEPAGLTWVGNANELNAGYAADGYARIKGFGALITTYGVGELSAINAIAGAFTERAAVVHIVGTPPRDSQDNRLLIHHTLCDGEYRHFGQMAAHVTAAQTNLFDSRTAADQIDQALRQCMMHQRPVYIEVPVDMVSVELPAARLETELTLDLPTDAALESAVAKLVDRLHTAKSPLILIDLEARPLGLADSLQRLVDETQWPTFTSSSGKDAVDNTAESFYGIHKGASGDAQVRELFDSSDLVLWFGPHPSMTNSYFQSSVPPPERTVSFTFSGIRFANELIRVNPVRDVLRRALDAFDKSKIAKAPTLSIARDQCLEFSSVGTDEPIRQDKGWKVMANMLRPGDIIYGETGTAGYGVREFPLPKHTRLFVPTTWLSIGYMLPAAQGAALAQKELIASGSYHGLPDARTVLVIGDGSFQMTCQEVSTMIRHQLNVLIVLLNNDGYTIERCIHGVDERYNDVASWRYLKALDFFGAPEGTYTGSARTYGELEKVLKDPRLVDSRGTRMVEVFMPRNDAPVGPLLDMMNAELKRTKV